MHNQFHEVTVNVHVHSRLSDGSASYAQIAEAAAKAGIDCVIITDHNVFPIHLEDYYPVGDRNVLLITGEEIHDQCMHPQKNHLLAFDIDQDFSRLAGNPQELIKGIIRKKGLCFLAHPFDPSLPAFGEQDISWTSMEHTGYTGIELWNHFSELKIRGRTFLRTLLLVFFPELIARGPVPSILQAWDEKLVHGRQLVAIGGSDSHALTKKMFLIRRIIFPYEFHFRSITNHLLLESPLRGEFSRDKEMVLNAFRKGSSFIGYDAPAPTKGFRFSAHGKDQSAYIGGSLHASPGVTLQIYLPFEAECHLIKDGQVIRTWQKTTKCTHITRKPGVYRVEVFIRYYLIKRSWIITNPIYLR